MVSVLKVEKELIFFKKTPKYCKSINRMNDLKKVGEEFSWRLNINVIIVRIHLLIHSSMMEFLYAQIVKHLNLKLLNLRKKSINTITSFNK
jgi:hypothetical protein